MVSKNLYLLARIMYHVSYHNFALDDQVRMCKKMESERALAKAVI